MYVQGGVPKPAATEPHSRGARQSWSLRARSDNGRRIRSNEEVKEEQRISRARFREVLARRSSDHDTERGEPTRGTEPEEEEEAEEETHNADGRGRLRKGDGLFTAAGRTLARRRRGPRAGRPEEAATGRKSARRPTTTETGPTAALSRGIACRCDNGFLLCKNALPDRAHEREPTTPKSYYTAGGVYASEPTGEHDEND